MTDAFCGLTQRLVERLGGTAAAARGFRAVADQEGPQPSGIRLDVSQPTLSRIALRAVNKGIQWQTFMALKMLGVRFGVGSPDEWVRSLYSPEARKAFAHYYRWITSELHRIDAAALHDQLSAVVKRAPADVEEKAQAELQKFRRWFDRQHPNNAIRRRLSLARALEPLFAARRAGGLELSCEEIAVAGRLPRYLRVALEREKLLLQRESDEQRAQKLFPSSRPRPARMKRPRRRGPK